MHFIFGRGLSIVLLHFKSYKVVFGLRIQVVYKGYKHIFLNGLIRPVLNEGRGLTLPKGYYVTLKLQSGTLCMFCTK